jgi:hypothetical protein
MCDHKQLETKFCPECGMSLEVIKVELEKINDELYINKLNEMFAQFMIDCKPFLEKNNLDLIKNRENVVRLFFNKNISYYLDQNCIWSSNKIVFNEDGKFEYLDDYLLRHFNKINTDLEIKLNDVKDNLKLYFQRDMILLIDNVQAVGWYYPPSNIPKDINFELNMITEKRDNQIKIKRLLDEHESYMNKTEDLYIKKCMKLIHEQLKDEVQSDYIIKKLIEPF